MRRVTVTGSESTGKTWLAERLANRFHTVWAPEFARQYALHKTAPLDASDVEPIARGQIDDAGAIPGLRHAQHGAAACLLNIVRVRGNRDDIYHDRSRRCRNRSRVPRTYIKTTPAMKPPTCANQATPPLDTFE